MSTCDGDDRDTMGYFLPRDSQRRLRKLRDYAEFFSHGARLHTANVERAEAPALHAGDMAICLEWLAEQMARVLDDVSFPAHRCEREAPGAGAQATPADAGARYVFGMTLEQVDTLHPLIDMIAAHGDAVGASHATELADHTLSLLGHAIFGDARALREVLRQVESQRLAPPRASCTGVREAPAAYRVVRKTGARSPTPARIGYA